MLTHGHEDHIGALPYILRDLNVPIYGTSFTLALVRKRLAEHGLLESEVLHEIARASGRRLAPFEMEFIYVTHCTIDCLALAMRTPLGMIIHTGDFKMDPTPIDGCPSICTLSTYGQAGVLALFSDSTNAERPGYTRRNGRFGAASKNYAARRRARC